MARDVGDSSREVADAAVQQVEMAAAVSEPVVNALVHAGHEYLICANRMSAGSFGFAARRLSRDFAFVQSLARCRQWTDAFSLQRDWARQVFSDYVANVADMTRLAGLAALESWPPIRRTAEARR